MSYKTIFTNYGLAAIAHAASVGGSINITQFVVGDGNGNDYIPTKEQTAVLREVYRSSVNRVYNPDPANLSRFSVESIIPAMVGGFTVREVGLLDENGFMVAISNYPATYKPEGTDGAFGDLTITQHMIVSNASVITLQVDPNVTVATQAWVLNAITPAFLLPGGTTGQILVKHSNTDGDVLWANPTDINVTVDCIEEVTTLSASQTVVILSATTTTGLAVYKNGLRLRKNDEWVPNATFPQTRITLITPATGGEKLICAQNEPNSGLDLSKYVKKAGDTMTGPLVIQQPAGAANTLDLQTPSGTNTTLRLAQTSQTGATIRALSGGVLSFGVDNGAGTTERMFLHSNGGVGIGSSFTPAYPLDVRSAEPMVSVRKPSANGNFYGYNIMAGTDILSSWLMNSNTGEVRYTAGYNGFGGFFRWNTNGVDRMYIGSTGLVGIGTDTPNAALNVTRPGTANTNSLFRWTDASLSTGYLTIRGSGGNGVGIGSDGRIAFSTGQNGVPNAFNERMTILADGKIGVGTSAPISRFDISGTDDENVTLVIRTGLRAGASISLAGAGVGVGTANFDLSQGSDYVARLWNYSNAGMLFATNGTARMGISADGLVTHGSPALASAGTESATCGWSRTYVEGRVNDVVASVAAQYYPKTAFTQSHATNGYLRLPNGTILQWGTATPPSAAHQDWSIGFPINFPSGPLNIQVSDICPPANGGYENASRTKSMGPTGFVVRQDWIGDNGNGDVRATSIFWMAIGN